MRKIKKAFLALSLAAAMVMGEAGPALAALPQQAAGGAGISADADYGYDSGDVSLDSAAAVAEIQGLNIYEYDSYLSIVFNGTGHKFDININGRLFQTVDNASKFPGSSPAPYLYDSEKFYDAFPGGTYKIEVVPYLYTEGGLIPGEAVSKSISVSELAIENLGLNVAPAKNKPNGYGKEDCIELHWGRTYPKTEGLMYEVQRKEGKGAWKTVGKTMEENFRDYNVTIGKSYQYRVRFAGGQNEYGKAGPGKWKSVKNAQLEVADVYISAAYDGADGGISITVNGGAYFICSGYEIYRSTNRTKGYKKIARTAYNSYKDTKVKSGTYYYKARAYYYDEAAGKIYYGDFSEPRGVKLVLGDIYATAKQTGNKQVTLEWNKLKGVSGYEVWYKTDTLGDAYKLYKTTAGTRLKVSGLTNDTRYVFKIRARKNGTNYYISNNCSCSVGFQLPAPVIAKKKVTANKAKTAVTIKSTIRWSRIYGAKQIRVVGVTNGYYDENGNYVQPKETVIKTLKGTATSYTLTSKLTAANKGYDRIKVVAVKGKDELASTVEGYNGLNDTTKLKVKRTNNAGSVISWKSVSGATKYEIYRQSPYGNHVLIGETKKCTYKDLYVTPGVQYTYYIKAVNEKLGIRSPFQAVEVTVNYTHKLGTPKIKSAVNASAKKATITWNKVSYASSYVVYRATGKNGKYKKVATVKKGKTTYVDKKLKKGTTYYYKIMATGKNAAGFTVSSALSNYKSVKIKK
ncbi:MAG: fibronectin type III domain-containing protein [Clostridium sp.]|nr:fibronectin type III domain-containing protein [Clostridium sp.]MCM1398450.1 fibronectin type III domain-containing protein [Clostridium sp.]MCM1460172.1 fibronectin type III domain-containing protein [Bacteroides sp.]